MGKPRSLRQLKLPLGVNRIRAADVRSFLKVSDRQPRRSKYGAIRTTAKDGREFDSKREATRYLNLRLMEQAGEISELECQKRFPLVVNGVKVADYIADFTYLDRDDEIVIEDSKGFRTQLYKLKKRLFEAIYGRRIKET